MTSCPDTVPVGLRSWYPTLRQKEGEGWGTHFCGWKRTGCGRSWFVVSQRRPDARRKTKVGPSAPLKSASLGMTVLGGRSEKQPRVLRLLAALVTQDDNSLGGEEKSNHRSFDSSLRSSLRMTIPGGAGIVWLRLTAHRIHCTLKVGGLHVVPVLAQVDPRWVHLLNQRDLLFPPPAL